MQHAAYRMAGRGVLVIGVKKLVTGPFSKKISSEGYCNNNDCAPALSPLGVVGVVPQARSPSAPHLPAPVHLVAVDRLWISGGGFGGGRIYSTVHAARCMRPRNVGAKVGVVCGGGCGVFDFWQFSLTDHGLKPSCHTVQCVCRKNQSRCQRARLSTQRLLPIFPCCTYIQYLKKI